MNVIDALEEQIIDLQDELSEATELQNDKREEMEALLNRKIKQRNYLIDQEERNSKHRVLGANATPLPQMSREEK